MKRTDSLMKLTYAARQEHISDSADISATTMVEEFTFNGSRGMFLSYICCIVYVEASLSLFHNCILRLVLAGVNYWLLLFTLHIASVRD